MNKLLTVLFGFLFSCLGMNAWASSGGGPAIMDFTSTGMGIAAVIIFAFSYVLVIGEEFLHLRKSKPVMIAAGLIWILVALSYNGQGDTTTAREIIEHNILEYAELLLFLLAAMTYVNTLEERNVFAALRDVLVSKGFSLKTIFWITGLLAFLISPIADNLTTALVMAAVVMAVAKDNTAFVGLGCINIVVAANAGGAFSPFGDITTLMVWQKGLVEFTEFFALFLPSVVNWLVPAIILSFFLPKGTPE
ncbi:MAG: Na+/H+ antiporter NhaD/arsenite permease-like protein, partial [Oleiphilaceae bacterium]